MVFETMEGRSRGNEHEGTLGAPNDLPGFPRTDRFGLIIFTQGALNRVNCSFFPALHE